MPARVALIGAGVTSRVVAISLARDDLAGWVGELLIADKDPEAAERVAEECRALTGSKEVSWAQLDARDVDAVVSLVRGYDVLINGAIFKVIPPLTKAALEARIPYIDFGSDRETLQWQLSLDEDFRRAGVPAFPAMGGSPGLINVLARLAADQLEEVREIRMREGWIDRVDYESLRIPLPVPYSFETILDEFVYGGEVWTAEGPRPTPPWGGREEFEFPEPVGRQPCYYVDHPETWSLGETFRDRGLRLVDYKLSFPDDLLEKYGLLVKLGFASEDPLDLPGCERSPVEVLEHLVGRSLRGKSWIPDDVDVMVVTANGSVSGRPATAVVTAIAQSWARPPASAHGIMVAAPSITAARMLVEGELEPGVHLPERVVDPEPFLREVARFGVSVDLSLTVKRLSLRGER